jgi:hypothetical protein
VGVTVAVGDGVGVTGGVGTTGGVAGGLVGVVPWNCSQFRFTNGFAFAALNVTVIVRVPVRRVVSGTGTVRNVCQLPVLGTTSEPTTGPVADPDRMRTFPPAALTAEARRRSRLVAVEVSK